ncbi:glycosyltransferase family 2 protein [Candidatus Pacearchaeota archaeon]|nr:glycosyltransferase family 2 protein [Candidatus Pacearchaeota archaeon]
MAKVSVVIPSYNEEKDIGACLESLKKQSYKNIEVILVDDGSSDNTLDVAKQTAKKAKLKLILLKQNHQGPGRARNLGAKKSRGEILAFVDSDMTFEKDYVKNLIEPIISDKTGKVIGTTHDYEVAVNTSKKYSNLWGKIRVSKEHANQVKIFRAIKKDKFFQLGGFDQKYGYADDQTFWFKHKIKPIVAKNTTCYHKNPDTLKGTYKQARWIGASWKERFKIFTIPILKYLIVLALFVLLPFLIILKSIKAKSKFSYTLADLIRFYSYKFAGYLIGITRAVYLGKVWK